jgi:hypothetical protein
LFGATITDSEILTLVDKLESCLLPKTEFHHRDHLAVAVVYLYSTNFDSALDRMRATLLRFTTHHGVRDRYHETLTRFWMEQVNQRLDGRDLCLREAVAHVQATLPDKDFTLKFYRRETLDSPQARQHWIEPDQNPHG